MWKLPLVALTLVALLSGVWQGFGSVTADSESPAMGFGVSQLEQGVCDDLTGPAGCTLAPGGGFQLSVVAPSPPLGGYMGFTSLLFVEGLVYQPTEFWYEEVVWPESAIGVRNINSSGFGEITISYQSASGVVPPFPLSSHVGSIVELAVRCPNDVGSHQIVLLPWSWSQPQGSSFKLADVSTVAAKTTGQTSIDLDGDTSPEVVDVVAVLDVDCLGATPTATNTPTVTPTPTITPTPSITPIPTVTPTKQPAPADTDGDGCSDQQENGLDETLGGRRDYTNPWDFYDVDGDTTITLFGDAMVVFAAYGEAPGPPYVEVYDRSPPPLEAEEPDPTKREPWDMGPPDGAIDLFTDISGVAAQFGHGCS